MAITGRKTLGLAFYDGMVLAAEVRSSGARRVVGKTAEFRFGSQHRLDDPQPLGAALGQFLRQQGVTARHAVIGLPALWLMTRRHSTPPTDDAALAGLLRIQAERAFSSDAKDLAIDYIDQHSDDQQRSVLLVATLRRKYEQALAVAEAASLKVDAVTSSTAALARIGATAANGGNRLMLQLVPGAAELAIADNNHLHVVKHLAVAAHAQGDDPASQQMWLDNLTSELRRIVAIDAGGLDVDQKQRLILWDGVGLPSSAAGSLGQRLSIDAANPPDLSTLAQVNGATDRGPGSCRFAAAVAMALTVGDRDLLTVDFLHSRLAPPRRQRFDRRARIAALIGLAVALLIGVLVWDWYEQSTAVEQLREQLRSQQPAVKAAEALIEKVELADGWFGARPPALECLREMTLMFPEDGRIWATDLSLQDNMRGILSGQATDDRAVLRLIESLQSSNRFTEVQLRGGLTYPRDASRDRSQLAFSLGFRFIPERK